MRHFPDARIESSDDAALAKGSVSTRIDQLVRVFVGCVDEDEDYLRALSTHLATLRHEGIIEVWDHLAIPPGMDQADEIQRQLARSDMIVLLVSSDFYASDYWNRDLQPVALKSEKSNDPRIVPVLVREVDKQHSLAGFARLPANGPAVKNWADHDTAWVAVVEGIRRIANEIQANKSTQERPSSEPRFPEDQQHQTLRCHRVRWLAALGSLLSLLVTGTLLWLTNQRLRQPATVPASPNRVLPTKHADSAPKHQNGFQAADLSPKRDMAGRDGALADASSAQDNGKQEREASLGPNEPYQPKERMVQGTGSQKDPRKQKAVTEHFALEVMLLVELEAGQTPIPEELAYHRDNPQADWEQLQEKVQICRERIKKLMVLLNKSEQGQLLISNFSQYRAIYLDLQRRMDIYDSIEAMAAQKRLRSLKRMTSLAREYESLHKSLIKRESALRKFLPKP